MSLNELLMVINEEIHRLIMEGTEKNYLDLVCLYDRYTMVWIIVHNILREGE